MNFAIFFQPTHYRLKCASLEEGLLESKSVMVFKKLCNLIAEQWRSLRKSLIPCCIIVLAIIRNLNVRASRTVNYCGGVDLRLSGGTDSDDAEARRYVISLMMPSTVQLR